MTSRRPAPEVARGFTLLEVLVSIALVLALVGSLYGFLHDMLATRARALEEGSRQRAAMTLIDRLEADLQACVVGGSDVGSGVRGNGTRIHVLTRGVATALAGDRPVSDERVYGDLQWVEYQWNAGTGGLEARRGSAADGTDEEDVFVPLGGMVSRLRLRYHDGKGWRGSFNSATANALPRAVEVAVWFTPDDSDASEVASPEPEDAAAEDAEIDGLASMRSVARENVDRGGRPPDRLRIISIPDPGSLAMPDSRLPDVEAEEQINSAEAAQ